MKPMNFYFSYTLRGERSEGQRPLTQAQMLQRGAGAISPSHALADAPRPETLRLDPVAFELVIKGFAGQAEGFAHLRDIAGMRCQTALDQVGFYPPHRGG